MAYKPWTTPCSPLPSSNLPSSLLSEYFICAIFSTLDLRLIAISILQYDYFARSSPNAFCYILPPPSASLRQASCISRDPLATNVTIWASAPLSITACPRNASSLWWNGTVILIANEWPLQNRLRRSREPDWLYLLFTDRCNKYPNDGIVGQLYKAPRKRTFALSVSVWWYDWHSKPNAHAGRAIDAWLSNRRIARVSGF